MIAPHPLASWVQLRQSPRPGVRGRRRGDQGPDSEDRTTPRTRFGRRRGGSDTPDT
ncbi:hypothetical protein [Nocardioides donggukensis]|uniref:Uncharacterized protein n=1 Tax=Nocardioides donggukensis TaxID=2774019 RepID=A0A927Q0K1_9ACTN|nr:hypothetical protein [Nocardioides donggukensis]MBD8868529.1 hypothetical protein [Nocardioides donggukensis]